MKCPHCGHDESKVTDSREVEDGVRRRRECLRCGLRFTTYERLQAAALWVMKRDGRREEFNREKLAEGIRKACAKLPISHEAIEKTVDDIEARLMRLGRAEVPSSTIGEMVLERLKVLDPVAYLRFASVYLRFDTVDRFIEQVQEAKRLLRPREKAPQAAQLTLLPGEGTAQNTRKPAVKRGRRVEV